jgi:putative pyruvate formate lyase activating enzyme
MGVKVSEEEFIEIMLEAQRRGAENINLVTAAPQIPPVVRAVKSAKARGLSIPVLWNTSSYETLPSLLLINEVVDGYLPDLKTLDADIAKAFFDAEDYPRYAERAILFMLEHKPSNLIIRHLILPGFLSSTRKVLEWFALHAAGKARLSLMTQYTPPSPSLPPAQRGGQCALQMPEPPCRRVNIEEYETALSWLEELGIEEGFYQELEDDASWLPDFTRENPFSSSLSRPLWHWRRGMIYTGLC